jgi:hypothetical protein
LFAAAFAAVIGVASAHAFTTTPGNHPEADEENILLNTGTSGPTVSGTTNQSQVIVNFTGDGETLVLPSQGQARIEAEDGSFTLLTVDPELATFRDLIFNINITGTGQDSSATVQFTAQTVNGAEASSIFDLGTGQNFFTLLADAGNPFLSITMTIQDGSANEIQDLRQVRISGVCRDDDPECGTPRVPEPGMLTLLGGAMLGLVGFARRRNGR